MPASNQVQLVLVSNPHVNSQEDFNQLAQWVHEVDPAVRTHIVSDSRHVAVKWTEPSLTVSPAPTHRFRPQRGPLFHGLALPKSAEYERLERAGIAVPKWTLLGPRTAVKLDGFGPYVVTKPDLGARGADVRIRRAERTQWSPPTTQQALVLGGYWNALVVQQFVYTGPWPTSVRVVTLFGEVLWALQIEASHDRRPLHHALDFAAGGYSIVSSGRGCRFTFCYDEEVLNLAQAAHAAFPDVPLLGIDVIRDATSGQLYVIEANSLGYTWHFSSHSGLALQQQFNLNLDAQFGGRRRAAKCLARVCRERAG